MTVKKQSYKPLDVGRRHIGQIDFVSEIVLRRFDPYPLGIADMGLCSRRR